MAEEVKPEVNNTSSVTVMTKEQANAPVEINAFGSKEGFELAQREARMLSVSSIVPAQFQGKIENCVIALEMAHRIGASPMMVMQNLYVVHGNPSFSSKFLIATINACGKFSPLRYIMYDENGEEIKKPNPKQKPFGCVAYAIDLKTGEELYGTLVDLNMAKSESWSTKAGSKWATMPELMLKYRAAAFFQRTYAPEVSMGMLSTEEVEDIDGQVLESKPYNRVAGAGSAIAARLKEVETEEVQVEQEKEPENEQTSEQGKPSNSQPTLF